MQRSSRGMWIAVGLLAVLLVAGPIFRVGMLGGMAPMGWFGLHPFAGPGMWGFGFGGFWIIRLVVLGALGWLALSMFRRGGTRGGFHTYDSPRDVLDRRFAAGELTREQYDEMRRALVSQP